MSNPHDDDDHLAAHDPHGDSHDDPQDHLAPDEPRTPTWLTVLGAGLFVSAAIFWLAARPASSTLSELEQAASPPPPSASAEPPPAPSAAPPPPAPVVSAAPPLPVKPSKGAGKAPGGKAPKH